MKMPVLVFHMLNLFLAFHLIFLRFCAFKHGHLRQVALETEIPIPQWNLFY